MTIEEFDNTGFTGQMTWMYKGKEYPIYMVDFEERLIAINETQSESYDEVTFLDWKRCENVELVNTSS